MEFQAIVYCSRTSCRSWRSEQQEDTSRTFLADPQTSVPALVLTLGVCADFARNIAHVHTQSKSAIHMTQELGTSRTYGLCSPLKAWSRIIWLRLDEIVATIA